MRHAIPIVLLLVATLVPSAGAADQRRPNLLVVMTDDQARWALGVYGNSDIRTPNMDRIGREGAVFTNAFVATPVCSPSRALFFTGKHGTQVGVTDWITSTEASTGVGLPKGTLTWPALLQSTGYRTALIGKWHLGAKPWCRPRSVGFDHFFGFLGGGMWATNPRLTVDGESKTFEGATADVCGDAAMRFIEEQHDADRPFALCLCFREPHLPYTPLLPEDWAPFEKMDPKMAGVPAFVDPAANKQRYREYYGSIHAADRNVGRVLDKLDALKLSENTIVLFTSDHGYNIGQHGIYGKGNGTWAAGAVDGPRRPNMFEESIAVPLLVRWPGVVKPGTRIDELVSNADIFRSVLGMLDVPAPVGAGALAADGLDFTPLLRGGKPAGGAWRDAIYGQYDVHNGELAFLRMIRTRRWKLVRHYFTSGQDELYDLKNDAGETKNLYLSPEARTTRDELQAKLSAWQQSIDDPLLKKNDAYPSQPPADPAN